MKRLNFAAGVLATLTLASATVATSCNWDTNTPGVTRNAKLSAENAYPEVPPPQETLQLADRGKPMFQRFACASCHSTSADRSGLLGPPLGGVATRVLDRMDHDELAARRWMVMHIKDPIKYPSPFKQDPDYRGAHMPPNPRISDDDMRALVEYLWLLPARSE